MFIVFIALAIIALATYILYLRVTREDRKLPRYARIVPKKQGDYYLILSYWSTDHSSRDMIIHNLDPEADEAKLVILKSKDGFIMQIYGKNGKMLYEKNQTTISELTNKFMELRRPPQSNRPPPDKPDESQPPESRTIEFK
ncbi:MAG: hypothetical protein LBI19_00120 [Oscillospiraceae bacterium]|nr:hypothetical protein [Oscillospiraceae bacterium]